MPKLHKHLKSWSFIRVDEKRAISTENSELNQSTCSRFFSLQLRAVRLDRRRSTVIKVYIWINSTHLQVSKPRERPWTELYLDDGRSSRDADSPTLPLSHFLPQVESPQHNNELFQLAYCYGAEIHTRHNQRKTFNLQSCARTYLCQRSEMEILWQKKDLHLVCKAPFACNVAPSRISCIT